MLSFYRKANFFMERRVVNFLNSMLKKFIYILIFITGLLSCNHKTSQVDNSVNADTVSRTPNIGEKRKSEFRNKMKVYYNDYISIDTTSFQSFFSKSFQQFQNKEYKNKEAHISNSEEFDQRSELKRHDSITEITDSIFQILYQRNCDDLKQFYALYKFQSTDTVENLYSCISQFFKISTDSAYKRFTINLDKIYKLNQNLNLFVIEDNSVQNFFGVGGLILAQISSNNDLICISICDKYQIKSSTYIEIYKEVRDKVYATQLNYKSKVGLFLPILAHSVIKAK